MFHRWFNSNVDPSGMLDTDPDHFRKAHTGGRWLVADYETRDVVVYTPVHAAPINGDLNGTMRLSTDLRFVNPNTD
jgi:hypothetical protein